MRGGMYNCIPAKAIGVPTQATCNFHNGLILKYVPLVGLLSQMVLLPSSFIPNLANDCH